MRRRVLVVVAVAVVLAVLALAGPLGVVIARDNVRDERSELQRTALTIAARFRGTPASLLAADAGTEYDVRVFDRDGRSVGPARPTTAPTAIGAALRGHPVELRSATVLGVVQPVSDGTRTVAVVVVSTPYDVVSTRTRNAWLRIAGLGLAAVLVALAAAAIVIRRLVNELDELSRAASSIDDDLAGRLPHCGVPEIDALVDALNGTVARISAVVQRERSFSSEVAHQLRTPLSGLRLEIEAIEQAGPSRRSVAAQTAHALESLTSLEATVEDIIALRRDVTRPAAGTSPRELVCEVEDRWRPRLARLDRPLRTHADPAVETMALSRAAANQLVDVLVDNAVRHGRGAVTLDVRRVTRSTAAIDVTDEGVLAAPGSTLFGSASARPAPGTGTPPTHGIGLPYARRLAEAMGARLALAGTNPTTFTVVVRCQESAVGSSTTD